MGYPASISSEEISANSHSVSNSPSKLKTLGFAIAIILGIGGLVVAGVGLGGYLHVGSLSHIGQVNSIIMMAAGGGGGILFLIVGIVGIVKKEKTATAKIHTGIVYGAEAWDCWNVQVVGNVPSPPSINWGEKDPFFPEKSLRETSILVFIPKEIIVDGKQQTLTLNMLKKIIKHRGQSDHKFSFYQPQVKRLFGDVPIDAGWILMTRDVIPDSREKGYDAQKAMVEKKGYQMLKMGEIAVGALMHHAVSEEQLYHLEPTRCEEKVNAKDPVVVGDFSSFGIKVTSSSDDGSEGVGALKRF